MVFYPALTCVSLFLIHAVTTPVGVSGRCLGKDVVLQKKKKDAALGLAAIGWSLGDVIMPILIIHWIPEVAFGCTMISAFRILALVIFANLTVQSPILAAI